MNQDISGKTAKFQSAVPVTSVHRVEADGIHIFYREAGDATAPVLLLLHGFPAYPSCSATSLSALRIPTE
jgi:hypothetical protein